MRLCTKNEALRKMIRKMPSLLGYNVDTNMEPKLSWLKQQFDLDDAELRKMVLRAPSLLNYHVENNIEPKLDWFRQRLHLDDAALSKMIQSFPPLLSYNSDTNLEPKLNFFIEALGSETEALTLVQQYPKMFSVSLEKRLKPRLEQARDAGIVIDTGCLRRIAMTTNESWSKSLVYQSKQIKTIAK